jgi:hypothetical protein
MRYAAPASWDNIVSGNRIITANKDTLEGCQRGGQGQGKRCAARST